ncbi:MAG: S8 family serine peptidase, partial [Candidatus Competibacteraceae bacterium]|nr:S8 family serine peptidase [Candidatus Competibacteraceae bacterium]
ARLPAIFHIRPTLEPILYTGSVNSAGDSILGAAQLRASIGVSGSGQTVGVLSDGVDHLSNAQASGDLPASVGVLSNTLGCLAAGTDCSCPTNTPNCDVKDEGTAMLEIVHDLAPGAQLLFSDAGASPEAFAQRILGLRNAGSSIIVDDIGWFGSPYYEDGIIAQTINSVTLNNDIAYFSSAGNQALEHYESFFNDTSGNGFHEFSAGDDSLGFILPAGATAVVFLQWNNKWGSANDDYDLLIADQNFQILAESTNTQNGTGDPFEVTGIVNTSDSEMLFNIGVKKFAGADREFTILLRNASAQEYISAGGITGHQAAEHCLAIGTINAQDAATNDIAPYSSQGPSRIYSYDGAGNPVGFTDRLKPDLTAIDGVLVTGAGGFGVADPNGSSNRLFFGTSAAAPHAAAIAALVRAAAPQLSATQVAQVLRSTALDIGAAGFDFASGSGRIDALASVQQVCPVCFQSSGSSTRMLNISTLGLVDNNGLAAGFIVQGPTPRRFVILGERSGSTIDAVLELTDLNGVPIASNDDWQGHPTAAEVQSLLGRSPGNALDAAFAVTLGQGVYIARLRSLNNTGGGIIAINDLSSGDPGGTRMINISTLGFVDGNGLAAGFIVQGPTPRRFVILGERSGSTIDAVLELTDLNGVPIAANDDWQGHPTAAEVQSLLGRSPGNALDAAFAVTLGQGVYIARLRSLNNTGGGIIAINDLSP